MPIAGSTVPRSSPIHFGAPPRPSCGYLSVEIMRRDTAEKNALHSEK
jgi:hypothetical protein